MREGLKSYIKGCGVQCVGAILTFDGGFRSHTLSAGNWGLDQL